MAWLGFVLAFCAALSNSGIDLLRKVASKRIQTVQLVCLVSTLEGTLSFAFVYGQGTLGTSNAKNNRTVLIYAFLSAFLRLVSLLLYQTAIQISSLSATIPYLSFTPVMLLLTAYLFIGEEPSWQGLIGVVVVTVGGFFLAFSATSAVSKKEDGPMPAQPAEDLEPFDTTSAQLPSPEGVARKGVACTGSMAQAIRGVQHLGESKGSVLMMLVAATWSLTATFDKMGLAASPSLASYLAVQRLLTATPCILYLIGKEPTTFRLMWEDGWILLSMAAAELLTVLLYLWSLKYLFVSYAIAAKRSGILASVLWGWLFFGENIRDKIFCISIMMAGMMLIVLSPDMKYNTHLHHP